MLHLHLGFWEKNSNHQRMRHQKQGRRKEPVASRTRVTLDLTKVHTSGYVIWLHQEPEGVILWVYSLAWGSTSTVGGQLSSTGCRSINLLPDEIEDPTQREATSCHITNWTDGKGSKKWTLFDFKFLCSIFTGAQIHICAFNTFHHIPKKRTSQTVPRCLTCHYIFL